MIHRRGLTGLQMVSSGTISISGDDEESRWRREYAFGLEQEIYWTKIPAKFIGRSFVSVSASVYMQHRLCLFALGIPSNQGARPSSRVKPSTNKSKVAPQAADFQSAPPPACQSQNNKGDAEHSFHVVLNPGASFCIPDGAVGFLIAEDMKTVQQLHSTKPNTKPSTNPFDSGFDLRDSPFTNFEKRETGLAEEIATKAEGTTTAELPSDEVDLSLRLALEQVFDATPNLHPKDLAADIQAVANTFARAQLQDYARLISVSTVTDESAQLCSPDQALPPRQTQTSRPLRYAGA